MREHYEELWARLPDVPPDAEARRREAFLLGRLEPGLRVLDLGCGLGHTAAAAAAAGARVVAADVASIAVERARAAHPGLDVRLVPIEGPLPLEDGAFDVVHAGEVIEHVADTAAWLSEARRVLAPGGRLLLTTPSHGRLRSVAIATGSFERHFDPLGDHLRFYTRRSLRSTLEQFGFEDVSVRAAGGLPLLRETLLASARKASWRSTR
ncbi:MAG: class I SAM-dependent methyltransferase [Solirubrobacteraceae bacterium]